MPGCVSTIHEHVTLWAIHHFPDSSSPSPLSPSSPILPFSSFSRYSWMPSECLLLQWDMSVLPWLHWRQLYWRWEEGPSDLALFLHFTAKYISSYEFFHAVDGEVLPWTKCGDYFCFNGGTCQNDTCQCSEGFGGDYCLYSGECTRWTDLLCTQCHITCVLCYTLQMCMYCSSLVMCADCANSTDNQG